MTTAIKIHGLKELQHKIDKLEDLTPVKAGLRAAALHVKGKIAVYPPESEANMPRTIAGTNRVLSWYERGYGTRYIGGGGRKTSETLGRKWTIKALNGGLTQIVGNNVSYSVFVQGERQAAFHKRRGWKTTDEIAAQESAAVTKFLKSHVDKALEG